MMRVRIFRGIVAFLIFFPVCVRAATVRYELLEGSRIERLCGPADAEERLTGSFDVTFLPVADHYVVEALSAVRWASESFEIRGSGFLQRMGRDRFSMVIDGTVNGDQVLLVTLDRQRSSPRKIRLLLTTPKDGGCGYQVRIVAESRGTDDGPDVDGDGVSDLLDNCRETRNEDQADEDGDGVGDTCDLCSGTEADSVVQRNGCSPAQLCPCAGPVDGGEWRDQKAYLRCLARNLKVLWRRGALSRKDVVRILHDAVRSGCGRQIVAVR